MLRMVNLNQLSIQRSWIRILLGFAEASTSAEGLG
jgi:hypothetical protein